MKSFHIPLFPAATALKFLWLLLCLPVLSLAGDEGPIRNGWQKTDWGMKPEQVTAAMPGAQEVKDAVAETIRGEELMPRVAIQSYEVAGIVYEVRFLFNRKAALTAVTLTNFGDRLASEQAIGELHKLLISRYGAANARKMDPSGNIPLIYSQKWSANSGLVEWSLEVPEKGKAKIVVTFMSPNDAEADKL